MRKALLVTFVTLIGLGLVVPAQAAPPADTPVVHTVQPGENLFRIALRYGTTVDALMAANGISDARRVYVGQRLVIPGAAGSGGTAPTPATGGTHVVQVGETLFRIALRYGLTTSALAAANGISNPAQIYAGQRLTIPSSGSGTSQPAPSAQTYVVLAGDSLSAIAYRFGVTVAALAQANGITNPSRIFPGQVLQIPQGGGAPGLPAATGNKRIIVDLSEQHLYAYQGDTLVYSFVVSTGMHGRGTAVGNYQVLDKIPMAYASTWNLKMPYWLGIYWAGSLENGIHALPILPNGQLLWEGYLGTPASYGCVILGTQQARQLYEWAEVGTPVTVRW